MKTVLKKIFYRILSSILGDGETVVLPILRGAAKGINMKLNLQKDSAYIFGKYDAQIIHNLKKLVKPGWVLWDIGIYIGFYSLFFSKLTGKEGKVIAFEPDLVNLDKAQENIQLNKLENVQFVNAAISDQNGQIDFIISGNTNSHLPGGYIGADLVDYQKQEIIQNIVKVDTITLDDAAAKYGRPDLVKIDIEGFELYALDHAEKLASSYRPIFLIESHNPQTDRKIFDFSRKYNYKLIDADSWEELDQPGNGTFFCLPQ